MNKKLLIALATTGMTVHSVAYAAPSWELSGLLEAEYSNSDNANDITAATIELAIQAQINEQVSADVVLLHEEDDTPLEVDVATMTLSPNDNFSITAGQTYIPFGVYETNMISDPLTLEIGETRESVIQANYSIAGFTVSAYMFNGTNQEDASTDESDRSGVNFAYELEVSDFSLSTSIGYISDISESDGIEGSLATNVIQNYIQAVSASVALSKGPFNIITEAVAALDPFQASELPHNSVGAEPSAFNLEFGYDMDDMTTLALGFQKTNEASALGLPEQRVVAAISKEIMENTTIAVEWASDEDYSEADSETYTIQLAVEF